LSDADKEYDRNAAMETLKAIVALGWAITQTGRIRSVKGKLLSEFAKEQAQSVQKIREAWYADGDKQPRGGYSRSNCAIYTQATAQCGLP
jgi:hypothetical protein